MSFLSKIGKIGAIAAPFIAAPFTGGLSLAALPGMLAKGAGALGEIGKVAGGAAKGSSDQRMGEGQLALQRYIAEQTGARDAAQFGQTSARDTAQFGQQGARDQFNTGLQGAQFGAGEQQRGMRNALVAQLLGGVQDANISGGSGRIPKMNVSGGLRPSALGNREALMAQLTQPTLTAPEFAPAAAYQAPAPYQAPQIPGPPTAGSGEKLLSGVGLGGSILGAIGGLFKKQPVPILQSRRVATGGPYSGPVLA